MAKTTCLRLKNLKSMRSYHAMTIYGMQSDKYFVIIKSILRTVRGSITVNNTNLSFNSILMKLKIVSMGREYS